MEKEDLLLEMMKSVEQRVISLEIKLDKYSEDCKISPKTLSVIAGIVTTVCTALVTVITQVFK